MLIKKMLYQILIASSIIMAINGGAMSTALAQNTSQLEKILKSKELRVCIWPDYYSITYRNPKTRQLSGIDISISQDFAKELGVKLSYIDNNFAQLIDSLVNDKCDVAMHAIGITPSRQEKLQFTQPYLRSDMYAITTKQNNNINQWSDLDQTGRVIAVAAGTVMEPVLLQRFKKAKILSVKAPLTREQEVESGRADAFMSDFPYSQRMIDLTDWAKVIPPNSVYFQTDYAYAINKGDDSLLKRLNQYITEIKKNGKLLQFAKQNKLDSIVILN